MGDQTVSRRQVVRAADEAREALEQMQELARTFRKQLGESDKALAAMHSMFKLQGEQMTRIGNMVNELQDRVSDVKHRSDYDQALLWKASRWERLKWLIFGSFTDSPTFVGEIDNGKGGRDAGRVSDGAAG